MGKRTALKIEGDKEMHREILGKVGARQRLSGKGECSLSSTPAALLLAPPNLSIHFAALKHLEPSISGLKFGL